MLRLLCVIYTLAVNSMLTLLGKQIAFQGSKRKWGVEGLDLLATEAEVHVSYLANRAKTTTIEPTNLDANQREVHSNYCYRISFFKQIFKMRISIYGNTSTAKLKTWIKALCGGFKSVVILIFAAFLCLLSSIVCFCTIHFSTREVTKSQT